MSTSLDLFEYVSERSRASSCFWSSVSSSRADIIFNIADSKRVFKGDDARFIVRRVWSVSRRVKPRSTREGRRRDSVGERGRRVSYKERGSFFIFGFLEGEGREEEREVVVVVVVVEVEVEVEVVVEVVGEGFPSSECLGKLRARERSRLVVLVLLKVSHYAFRILNPHAPKRPCVIASRYTDVHGGLSPSPHIDGLPT